MNVFVCVTVTVPPTVTEVSAVPVLVVVDDEAVPVVVTCVCTVV